MHSPVGILLSLDLALVATYVAWIWLQEAKRTYTKHMYEEGYEEILLANNTVVWRRRGRLAVDLQDRG